MISFFKRLFSQSAIVKREKQIQECYYENRFSDKNCYGLTGGDYSTGYLQIECVDCPYRSAVPVDET